MNLEKKENETEKDSEKLNKSKGFIDNEQLLDGVPSPWSDEFIIPEFLSSPYKPRFPKLYMFVDLLKIIVVIFILRKVLFIDKISDVLRKMFMFILRKMFKV